MKPTQSAEHSPHPALEAGDHHSVFAQLPRRRRRILYWVILAGLWAGILYIADRFEEVLTPFLGGLFLAYLLEPIVTRLAVYEYKGRRLGRVGGILAIYFAFFGLLYLLTIYAGPRISEELSKLAKEGREFFRYANEDGVARAVAAIDQFLVRNDIAVGTAVVRESVEDVLGRALSALRENFTAVLTAGQVVVSWTIRTVFTFFLVLMVTAFFATDWYRVRSFLFTLVPIRRRDDYETLMVRLDTSLSGVVRGQLLICLVNGILTFVGLLLLEVKYPVLLGLLAAVFSLIPIFGSILSSIPIVGIALTAGPLKAVLILLWIVGIHIIEANLLNPKIMGDATRIHPVLVVFAVVAGEHTYGVPGALFAVPVASIFITLFKFFHRRMLELLPEARRRPQGLSDGGVD